MVKINHKNQYASPYEKIRIQVAWLKDFNETIDFDFIGRFENLEEDVNTLGKLLNMNIRLPLTRPE